MTSYEDLEDDYKARLEEIGASVVVKSNAENEVQADDVEFVKPTITISFQHSDFSGSIPRGYPEVFSTAEGVQYEYAEIHMVFNTRLLRGENGMYATIAKAQEKLLGFSPNNWQRTFFKSLDYLENTDGRFTWSLVCVCRRLLVEKLDYEDLPLLQELSFNINHG